MDRIVYLENQVQTAWACVSGWFLTPRSYGQLPFLLALAEGAVQAGLVSNRFPSEDGSDASNFGTA